MNLLDAEHYCQQKVIKSGSSFYYSFLFLPPEQRKAIIALYAFCKEVDDIVDNIREPSIAGAKLAWWSEEVARLFQKTATHPITMSLQSFLPTIAWQKTLFDELLTGMAMDLHFQPYAQFEDLKVYCYRVASVVGMLTTYIFSGNQAPCLSFARDLGIALQLVNIIRDIGEDIRRGRLYLPVDECKRFDIDPASLLTNKNTEGLKALLQFQANRAKEYYAKALASLPLARRVEHQSALMMATIYFELLKVIEKDGFNVLSERYSLTPLRKCWIAFRTHRRLKKGKPL